MWRREIAVHSEMPTPRGVVKLWSALRAHIDLTCAWKSPWTNHTQPRFPLLGDGCGRPRGALFSSSLHSGFPAPIIFCLSVARMSKGSVLEAFHSQPSTPLCPLLSSCAFFKNSSVKDLSSPLLAGLHFVLIWAMLFSSYCLRNRRDQRAAL